jgi:protease IV
MTESLKKIGTYIWIGVSWLWRTALNAIGSIIVLAVIFLVVISFIGDAETTQERSVLKEGNYEEDGEIVVVDLSGQIVEKSITSDPFNFDTQVIGSDQVAKTLDELADDPNVKGVILRINSPGGGVVASDMVYTAVRDFAENKPVVATISESAASGGYYIAVGANHIIAHPSSVVGSIGVIGVFPNVSGLLDTLGIDMQVIQTGQYKDTGSAFRAMNDDEQEMIQTLVDEALEEFVAAVDEGRDLSREEVEALADGRIMSGRQALEVGLVDTLGTQNDAFEIIKELAAVSDPSLTEFSSGGFLESLFSMMNKRIQMSQLLGLNSLALNQSPLVTQAMQNKPGLYYMSEL